MKKKQEKAKYESPFTKKTTVILESSICAASANIKNPASENGRIEEHQLNTGFGFEGFQNPQDWDDVSGNN